MPLPGINKSTWKEDFGMTDMTHHYEEATAERMPTFGGMPSLSKRKTPALPAKNPMMVGDYEHVFSFAIPPDKEEECLPKKLDEVSAQIEELEKTWFVCFVGANSAKDEVENELRKLSTSLKSKRLSFIYRFPWEICRESDFESGGSIYTISGRLNFLLEDI
jgi:hypothetical protein